MAKLDMKLKLTNTLATILLVGFHGFSYYGWFLGQSYEFGPKGFAFILNGLLQVLLIGFTVYQYLPNAPKDVYEAISYWYLLVAGLNTDIALSWFFHFDTFAFVFLLWQLATLLFIYHRLRDYTPRNGTDHAFLNAPFSIFTAYSLFTVLWQIFQLHNDTKHNKFVHIFIIIVIGSVALHLVDGSHRKDWVFALTTAWILLGTSVFLTDMPHTISLITVGVLIRSAVARTSIPDWLDRLDRRCSSWANRFGERTPLLSNH